MKKMIVVLTVFALVLSTMAGAFAAEVFEGSAQGFGGTVAVKVTFENGAITGVEVDAANETPGIGSKAAEELPAAIVAANNPTVDTVTGATTSLQPHQACCCPVPGSCCEVIPQTTQTSPGSTASGVFFAYAPKISIPSP